MFWSNGRVQIKEISQWRPLLGLMVACKKKEQRSMYFGRIVVGKKKKKRKANKDPKFWSNGRSLKKQ